MTVKWTFEGAISVFVCIFWSQLISNWQNTSQSEYATRVNKKHIFYYLRFYSNAPNKDLARLCSQPLFEKKSCFLSPNRGSNYDQTKKRDINLAGRFGVLITLTILSLPAEATQVFSSGCQSMANVGPLCPM